MRTSNILLLFFAISLAASPAAAADHCVRAGASYNGDGSTWASASSTGGAGAYNALPSRLVRGDTYYVADGTYSSYTFDDATSGSSYIYIKKATPSAHGTNTGWSNTYGDGQATFGGSGFTFSTSYYDIDGVVGAGNGSASPHGIVVQPQTVLRNAKRVRIQNSADYISIKHTALMGQGPGDSTTGSDDGIYIAVSGSSHLTFSYLYMYDFGRCPILWRDVSNVVLEYSYIHRNESTSGQHAEAISASTISGAGNNNVIIRHNIWRETDGTGVLVFRGDGWEVYGNLFFDCDSNNGAITTWSTDPDQPSVTNAKVYNNTIVDGTGLNSGTTFAMTGASPSGNAHYNNIYYNCPTVSVTGMDNNGYNYYGNISKLAGMASTESTRQMSTTSPFVNYGQNNFALAGPTQNGKDDLGSPYNRDMLNALRGADGTWDRGAYEYGTGGDIPSPPTNLRVIDQ